LARSSFFSQKEDPDSSASTLCRRFSGKSFLLCFYVAGMAVIFIAAFGTMAAVPDGKTADPLFPTALFLMFPLFWLIMTGGFAISLHSRNQLLP
jgi:ABC-type antimicrobial peptide transport system permease subunit